MAIVIQYVVEHKGVEKLVTTDKKAADQYDKMLDIADNLAQYLEAKGIKLDPQSMEEMTVMMAKNKTAIGKLFKGTPAETLLSDDSAEVVEMKQA
ncbi:YebG family protein [Aestuariibacter halophilus]|uniref:YebG family protein n=1 Tax=Fluctibacter halophilus TaxID=226011 RepID=A0ABS8GA12_9ALTE|nr:YebG family protein [Aestuariibacter halophilus]MCC2616066.1 YebG family protein [Aestuariibacter halophilus]